MIGPTTSAVSSAPLKFWAASLEAASKTKDATHQHDEKRVKGTKRSPEPDQVGRKPQVDRYEPSNASPSAPGGTEELTEEEQKVVDKLKARDAEVKVHEQAHLAAAGKYGIGSPKYEYQTGPDGKKYAIGGHVNIDASPVDGDPKATIEKANVVKRSALAPKEPSNKDKQVAREADVMKAQAQAELREMKAQEKVAATDDAEAATVEDGQAREKAQPFSYTEKGVGIVESATPSVIDLLA